MIGPVCSTLAGADASLRGAGGVIVGEPTFAEVSIDRILRPKNKWPNDSRRLWRSGPIGASARFALRTSTARSSPGERISEKSNGRAINSGASMAHYNLHALPFQEKGGVAFDHLRQNRYTRGLRRMPCPDGCVGGAGY